MTKSLRTTGDRSPEAKEVTEMGCLPPESVQGVRTLARLLAGGTVTALIAAAVLGTAGWVAIRYRIGSVLDTAYAPDFDVPAFGRIKPGDSRALVKELIGDPLSERREYAYRWGYSDVEATTISFAFDRNHVVLSYGIAPSDEKIEKQVESKIHSLSTSAEVGRTYGKPSWEETGSDATIIYYSCAGQRPLVKKFL